MALTTGTYEPKTAVTVAHWPKADKNGDGPELWENEYDRNGEYLGNNLVKNAAGDIVHDYLPPDGFKNLPGFDHTDNWVRVDGRGQVIRQPNGEAINIAPGVTVVMNPDGSAYYLRDDRARYLFELAHQQVGDAAPVKETSAPAEPVKSETVTVSADQMTDFEAWVASQKTGE
jgi:hypothetical protein